MAALTPAPSMTLEEEIFKILLVGDIGTGKTQVRMRLCHDHFTQDHKRTIGVDFGLRKIKLRTDRGEKLINLQIWDIAGQERFGTMTRIYYKEAAGAILVGDLTRKKTIEALAEWRRDIEQKMKLEGSDEKIPLIALLNKVDELDGEAMSESDVEALRPYVEGCNDYFFTSAKEGRATLLDAIKDLVRRILQKRVNPDHKEAAVEFSYAKVLEKLPRKPDVTVDTFDLIELKMNLPQTQEVL